MQNLYGVIVSFIFIAVVIVSSKMFENVSKEASRKFIHIILCNWWIIAMIFFQSPIWACIVPAIFVVINYVSYKYNIISPMERDSEEEKKQDGLGTVYYAVSLLVLAFITFGPLKNPAIGLVGILVMGYGDGFAAIVGKSIKSKEYQLAGAKKTLAGSAAMFIISFIIIYTFLVYSGVDHYFLKGVLIAVMATLAEAIGIKGTDNLTVPLLTSFMVSLFLV